MLSKCANPACSTPLIYLREGKIFMMDGDHRSRIPVKSAGRVEHFWLCGPCSAHLTLVCTGQGVSVVPKKEPRAWRAAAS